MVFSSPYFLFLFLPLALATCFAVRRFAYLHAIMIVSVLFYYWSAGTDTLILVGLIAGNFVAALKLARRAPRPVFAVLLLANLAILLWYKYAKFLARNIDAAFGTELASLCGQVALPAGVSFFVFQAISYLVDVRRGDISPETQFVRYGAYQSFFPHLIAGPIVRFRDVIGDLVAPRWSSQMFASGVSRFAHGLLKKTVLADGVAPIANAVFELKAHDLDFSTAWVGAIAYSLQIYFDFSGYSDMAIGLAQLFGIQFHENFERPYSSRSATEFWRRWHISLSSWFRDYVYIPLGGSRSGTLATYRNLLIVFAVTGLWHGAAWTFLAWGLYHGLFLVLERIAFGEPTKALRSHMLRYFYCLPIVVFGWVLFRAPTLRRTFRMWKTMLSPADASWINHPAVQDVLSPYAVAALAVGALIFLLPGQVSFGRRLGMSDSRPVWRWLGLGYTMLALLASGTLVLTGSYSPFLYFNF